MTTKIMTGARRAIRNWGRNWPK
jgi:hypothetical protein